MSTQSIPIADYIALFDGVGPIVWPLSGSNREVGSVLIRRKELLYGRMIGKKARFVEENPTGKWLIYAKEGDNYSLVRIA